MKPLENLDEIRDVARTLLLRADVGEHLPTPVDDIIAATGLVESDEDLLDESMIRQLPRELGRILRGARRKILGALDRRERVVHISPTIDVPARRQFVRCHEVMHDALPWQQDLLVLADSNATLAPSVELLFEREANQGGAELLFQLDLLARVGRDYPTDITTPIQLAELFGASIHSTFRRWVEEHPNPVCGLVLAPNPIAAGAQVYARKELVESVSWTNRYGPRRFPARLDADVHPFVGEIGLPWSAEVDGTWEMHDRNGELGPVRIQTFCNSYRRFVLVWPPVREGLIARHRVVPRIERI